jgi:hypothetical protein
MRTTKWRALSTVALLVAATAGMAGAFVLADRPAAANGGGGGWQHGWCSQRVCLVVLDSQRDTDGDGFPDVDEKELGTDPYDANSHPPVLKALDLLLAGRLPSFERHLTELVVLPEKTPDGQAIDTGLGQWDLNDHDLQLLNTFADLTSMLEKNGFEDLLSLRVKPKGGPDISRLGVALANSPRGQAELASIGDGFLDLNLFGPNGSKPITDIAGGEHTIGYGDKGDVTHGEYDVTYADGSHDHVVEDRGGAEDPEMDIVYVNHYDKDGKLTGSSVFTVTSWKEKDGSRVTQVTEQKYDANGQPVGEPTTTVNRTKPDAPERDTSGCPASKLGCEGGATVDKFSDPDYIEFDIRSPEALARVELRIKHVGQPMPDEGGAAPQTDPLPSPAVTATPTAPEGTVFGDAPLVSLFDPDDGTVVFARSGEAVHVGFNPLEPDYVPWHDQMTNMVGDPEPTRGTADGY